jgi:hypothetical protein
MKLRFSGIAPATVEWAWRVANWLAIAAALGSCVAAFQQASAKVVGLVGLFSFLAMCITYVAGIVRERASRAELESARFEIERLHGRTARRNLTDDQRAALKRPPKSRDHGTFGCHTSQAITKLQSMRNSLEMLSQKPGGILGTQHSRLERQSMASWSA